MSHVFISYSRHDSEYVEKLVEKLRTEGFTVWFDKQTDYGEEWWRSIVRAIRDCGALIVVMSPASGESRWVEREMIYADNQRKRIFPLLLEGDLDSSETWALFAHTFYTDVRDKSLPPARFYDTLARYTARNSNAGQVITSSSQLSLLPPPDVSAILPPPFEWRYIPAGKVTLEYGEWQLVNDSLKYQVTSRKDFEVPAFHMAKYPITSAQFEVFVKAKDGYRDACWWDYSDEAKAWRAENAQPEKSTFDGGDCPRTDVSWYEAVAFCQWLDPRTGSKGITLPTEQQWQRVAQGDDGRTYPWGNDFNKSRCNTSESGIRRTTPVTRYLNGVSPFKVMGMAGNVWEWCRTTWKGDSIELVGNSNRVLRGGSWDDYLNSARAVYRSSNRPANRYNNVGFRLVVSPHIPHR
jgi:formylglycine-generating enzyme required for sulfatase activity